MPPWRVYLLFPYANSLPNRRLFPPEFPSYPRATSGPMAPTVKKAPPGGCS